MSNNSPTIKLLKVSVIISVLLSSVTTEDDTKAVVRIKDTVILGKTESFDGNEYNVFKGIPYAEPPIGDLRFRKPLPIRQWPEKVEAYDWPNPCFQHISKSILMLKNTNLSEDCLKLNIWTPADSLTSDTLKPVLLYIHGGALLWGAAHYQGEVLVTRGDIIFIDIQYRLSTLGFMYTGKDEAPGNVGLLDQALALEWVSDNIRYFGGDPQQITIMGMSAGSWSVSMHILSPLTRNLFRYAIMQSAAMNDHIL